MYVGQVALSFIPNVEVVSLLVIVVTCVFRFRAIFSIYIFVICEVFTYGFNMWVINYLYIWAILWLAILLVSKSDSKAVFALISALFGLLFGTLCSIPYFILGGIGAGIGYIAQGIVFDLIHCVGNLVLTLLLYSPLNRVLRKAVSKYI